MINAFYVIVSLILISAIFMTGLAFRSWERRSTAIGAGILAVLLLAMAWWTITNVVESLLLDPAGKIFWSRCKYFGIVSIPPLTLAFILQYTRRGHWLKRKYIAIAFIIALMTFLAIWTDPWHHLFYAQAYLLSIGDHPFIRTQYGVLFYVHSVYSYTLLFIAIVLMGVSAYQSPRPFRRQQWSVFIAMLLPLLASIITLRDWNPLQVMDLTPVTFSISGAAIFWAVFRQRLLDAIPIARQIVLENILDGILVLDMDNHILDMNAILEKWVGKNLDQVTGRGFDSIFSDDVTDCLEESWLVQDVVEIETPFQGNRQVLEARPSLIYDQSGRSIGRLLLLQDVTERKAIEQSLWQANSSLADALELNQQIISSSDVGILAYEVGGKCVLANEAAAKVAGVSFESVLNSDFRFYPDWKMCGLLDAADHVLASKQPYQELFHIRSETGREVWFECYLSTFTSQEQLHLLVLVRDVSEIKRLENDLAEARTLLGHAFEQSPVPIVLLRSPSGVIEMMNPACRATLKIEDPAKLIGTPIAQAQLTWEVRESDGRAIPRERWPLSLALRGEKLNNFECQLRFDDGSVGWTLINATPVLNKSGVQIAVLMVFIDITERRLIEQNDREQRILAEAYRDTAATLNSTIQLDTVLTLVLTNIELVVPHDAACVVLYDTEGTVNRTRFRGFIGDERQEALELCRKVTEMADWRQNPTRPNPLIIPDVSRDSDWQDRTSFTRLRSFLNVPIHFKDRLTGIILLASATPNFFASIHAERLQVFADQAAIAIENARLYSEVQHLTLTDELTHIYNYRGLIELGQREYDRARRFERPLSLLFFDIDHFREFNNRYSHAVGNQVLEATAKIARGCLRGVDLIARYGGEEFVVLLPETILEEALQIAERIRQEVAETFVLTRYGRLSITVSIGVAELTGEQNSLLALIDRANQAEHRAKAEGRNRVSTP
jgi:diguanylate cyclase (GGDEF)-like protein/PAS domain S-box-containing protein